MSAYAYNAYNSYLEQKVLGASPLELVRILYHASLDSVRAARRHLASGDIAARSAQIDRASQILLELTSSVDRERGGIVAARLIGLYAYMQRLLLQANLRQADEPLAEVARLLETVLEGWQQCETATITTAARAALEPVLA